MSRRILVVATCFVVLLGLTSPPRASALDPATIAAVVAIAKDIRDIFASSDDQDINQINAKLDEVNNRLMTIESKIDNIQKSLDELKVYIGDQFELESRVEVLGAIDLISQSYDGWTKHVPNGPDPKQQLLILQNAARKLMRRSSFGNFEVVSLAMAYERNMYALLKTPPAYQLQAYKAYADYFRSTLDPTNSGSLSARQQTSVNAIQAVEREIASRKPLYCTTQPSICHRSGEGTYTNDEVHIISGDLNNGFADSGELRWVALLGFRARVDFGPECPAVNLYLPQSTRRDSCLKYLNDLRTAWTAAGVERDFLDKCMASANTSLIQAAKWAGIQETPMGFTALK